MPVQMVVADPTLVQFLEEPTAILCFEALVPVKHDGVRTNGDSKPRCCADAVLPRVAPLGSCGAESDGPDSVLVEKSHDTVPHIVASAVEMYVTTPLRPGRPQISSQQVNCMRCHHDGDEEK